MVPDIQRKVTVVAFHISESSNFVIQIARTDHETGTVDFGFLLVFIHFVQTTCLVAGEAQTYHVAFLGLDTPEAASLKFLYADSPYPTATTRLDGCETLAFNTDLTYVANPCLSNLFPQGSNVVDFRAVKIEATTEYPVHVNVKHNGVDEGFLAIPDAALGTEYYVATFCRFGGYCQFSVTPVEDGTSVMVRFLSAVNGAQVCISGVDVSSSSPADIPFLLDEFDVLHFESTSDLTGTYITSNKKIAVFAGARNVPSADSNAVSHVIEQLPPVNKWGKEFLVVPNNLNPAGDEFIIVTSAASTKVEISGFSPFVIPYAGQFVTRRIDWGMYSYIETSNPVLVVQMMSIDIYNDSSSVQGNPSMLLAQSVDHFVHDYTFNIGENPSSDPSVFIAVVAETTVKSGITAANPIPSGSWTQIANTKMWAATSLLSSELQQIKHSSQRKFGLYGYLGRSRASLISMSWNEEAEVCTKSASAPGDGVDNDCNGEIDEDTACTEEDLTNSFTIEATTERTLPVGGLEYMTFTVRSCGLVFATLSTPAPSTTYFLVELSPEHIHAHVCSPECDGTAGQSAEKALTRSGGFDCNATAISYWMSWSGAQLKIDEGSEADPGSSDALSLPIVETPETITFSIVFTGAEISTDISVKDCAKIISGQADSRGKVFYIPVKDSDVDFTIFMTPNVYGVMLSISIKSLDGTVILSNPSVMTATWTVTKTQLNPLLWDEGIYIEATGGEILVYVIRKAVTEVTGFHVLPSDILGASFMIVNHADSTALHTAIFMTMGHDIEIQDDTVIQIAKHSLHEEPGLIGAISLTKPAAVFSVQTNGDIITQMPPVETLGKTYYIPAIDLTSIGGDGTIIVVSTEDSTYVIIKGAYDQGYEVAYAGDEVRRAIDDTVQMSIESSKPVLVSLVLDEAINVWSSMVTIPAIDQYTTQHTFPATPGFAVLISVAVSRDGSPVTSQIDSNALSSKQTTQYPSETFSLTFLRSTAAAYPNAVLVIKSDEAATTINTVCRLSTAGIGDGLDNDCDGLVDEEYCYSNDTPGYIDYDIDGEFNEDCKEQGGSYTASSTLTFNILSTSAPCPETSTPAVTQSPTTPGDEGSGSSGSATPTTPHTTGFSNPSIVFPESTVVGNTDVTTTPSAATASVAPPVTAPPVETCVTDCICPCGWVDVQNYTAEEIQEKVLEIQQKLKIDKAILSAQKRKKTSAQDNRPTAMGIGYVGLCFLIVTIGSIFLLDLTSISRDIMLLKENLRDVFDT